MYMNPIVHSLDCLHYPPTVTAPQYSTMFNSFHFRRGGMLTSLFLYVCRRESSRPVPVRPLPPDPATAGELEEPAGSGRVRGAGRAGCPAGGEAAV